MHWHLYFTLLNCTAVSLSDTMLHKWAMPHGFCNRHMNTVEYVLCFMACCTSDCNSANFNPLQPLQRDFSIRCNVCHGPAGLPEDGQLWQCFCCCYSLSFAPPRVGLIMGSHLWLTHLQDIYSTYLRPITSVFLSLLKTMKLCYSSLDSCATCVSVAPAFCQRSNLCSLSK